MNIKRERQQDVEERNITERIPEFVKESVSPETLKQLSATIVEYGTDPVPSMGEQTYTGTQRITGYGSKINKYNEIAFYNSADIPLNVLDTMRRDYQVALGMAIVKFPISNLGFTVDCNNDVIKGAVELMMGSIWSKTLKNILLSLDYGFTAFEKVWERKRFDVDPGINKHKLIGRNFIWLTKLKSLYPTTIGINLDDLNNFSGVTQHGAGRDIFLNQQKSMVYTYQEEFGNYFGRSRLVGAYEPWYWKIICTQFVLRYLERHSIPPYIVSYPLGQVNTSKGKVSAAEMAEGMMRGISSYGNAMIPSETKDGEKKWDIKQLDQGSSNMPTPMDILAGWDKAILRGLLLPDKDSVSGLTPEIATEIFISTLQDVLTTAQAQINAEIIEPFVAWNFSKYEQEPCTLNINEIDFKKREEMRKLMSKMMDMSATFIKQKDGLPFNVLPDMNKMCEVLDIPAVPAALYELPTYDQDGIKLSKEELAKREKAKNKLNNKGNKSNGNSGPDKGQLTSGNQSRTGRDGTPRDQNKQDEQI
jgi:hypothetical protein